MLPYLGWIRDGETQGWEPGECQAALQGPGEEKREGRREEKPLGDRTNRPQSWRLSVKDLRQGPEFWLGTGMGPGGGTSVGKKLKHVWDTKS